MALFDRPLCHLPLVDCSSNASVLHSSKILPNEQVFHKLLVSVVSDIAIFVLKRDVKLQLTN